MVFNPIWIPRFTYFVSHGNVNRISAEPKCMIRPNTLRTDKSFCYLHSSALIYHDFL